MTAGANICGVLVHAIPARIDDVLSALATMPGVEVHGAPESDSSGAGRIVVTVEDTPDCLALDTLGRIHRTDGIVAAALVYHHFDVEPALGIGHEAGA